MKKLCLLMALMAAYAGWGRETRGTLGIYPGDPKENFTPTLVPAGKEYRNLALQRAARQSSAFSLEQSAQLATDGLRADGADFRSAWKSAGARDEWIVVDLGAVASIDRLVFHWLNAPVSGTLQVSADGERWKNAGPLAGEIATRVRARFVKAVLDATANEEPFELEELEVWGRGGVKPLPKPAAGRQGAEQELAGGNWKLVRASAVEAAGEEISTPGYNDGNWLVATVPGTVLASYVALGAVPDPNYEDWHLNISDSYFRSDFWYRDVFEAHPDTPRQFLHFDGVNYKARIYLNGKYVGGIESAFDAAGFDVTGLLREGSNCLAVHVVHNPNYGEAKAQTATWHNRNGGVLGADNPTMHATIGWDWLPTVRGRNMGIYDRVYLRYTGDVTVEDPFVRTELALPDTTRATILAGTTLVNHADKPVEGILTLSYGDLTLTCVQRLAARESRRVDFDPAVLEHPRLWWPNGYGRQELYPVRIRFGESDSVRFLSGVRQLTYEMTPYALVGKLGFKGRDNRQRLSLYVNGRRLVGFGGNWGYPEHLLNYRSREYDIAVRNHAAQHFTLIRNWVGMTDNKAFYEACDRYGILIWQDFWLANPADGPDPADAHLFNEVARRYVRRIRNHPSIGLYCGRNEGYPPEAIDRYLERMVPEEHPGSYYIPHSGADGVSGGGPYRYLPVKQFFQLHSRDKMSSERGMPAVMNYENLVRTLGKAHVEPVSTQEHPNLFYGLHDYTLGERGKWSAQRCTSFNAALEKGFGRPADAREFAQLAQWLNYDGYRAIFESRSEYRRGILLWMSHPAWPSLVWQTYDYFFEPTAAFFGCRKACEPIHILYNPVKDSIAVVNYHAGPLAGLTATARVLDLYGKEVWTRSMPLDIPEDETIGCFPLEVPEGITDTYFIKLELTDSRGSLLSDNFYWQGVEEGNWRALRTLDRTRLRLHTRKLSPDRYKVTLRNTGAVPALMVRLKAVDGATGDLVLPVWYSDNYFFLMPGESREVEVEAPGLQGRLRLCAEGMNI